MFLSTVTQKKKENANLGLNVDTMQHVQLDEIYKKKAKVVKHPEDELEHESFFCFTRKNKFRQ